MYVMEPRRVPSLLNPQRDAWQMFCRVLYNRTMVPISNEHLEVSACRSDPVAKAWAEYIPACGSVALEALEWAWRQCQQEKRDLRMPPEEISAFQESRT